MRFFLSAALALLTSACSTAAQPPASHDLGVSIMPTAAMKSSHITAPNWLQDNRIRYRLLYSAPTEVRFYSLDRWLAPPPELLEHLITSENYLLNIQLNEFEQRFDTPHTSRVVLEFFVEAFNPETKQRLDAQGFHFERTTVTPDAAGAIAGLADLTQQAAEKVKAWLTQLPAQ